MATLDEVISQMSEEDYFSDQELMMHHFRHGVY